MSANTFIFDSYNLDLEKAEALFKYELETDDKIHSFTEKFILPSPIDKKIPTEVFDTTLSALHILLGISYWKTYTPQNIIIKSTELNSEQAQFWNMVYTKGLGEFFFNNTINFHDLISFPSKQKESKVHSFPRSNRSLVAIGGGKDSIVSIELLKKQKKDISGYVVETEKNYEVIEASAKIADIDLLRVKRYIDPKLFELNKEGAHNGHIPISALYAAIGVLLAVVYDYHYVIASNEHSSNYGNVEYLGETINHQWSKSFEFEEGFQNYIHNNITTEIIYFSLLRQLNEIKIAELFSVYPQYFSHFSSCNRNFSIKHPLDNKSKWCGECPKCAFAFVLLSAYLPKQQLLQIFGQNLLNKERLMEIYKELLGVSGFKPFECVGTPEETKVAFYMAYEKGDYDGDVVVKMFVNEVLPEIEDVEKMKNDVMNCQKENSIPEQFKVIFS